MITIERRKIDVAKAIIEKGADINFVIGHVYKTYQPETALMLACDYGFLDFAKLFVENGAGLNHSKKNGVTPLMIAVRHGHLKVVEYLIDHGADIDPQNSHDGQNALMIAAAKKMYEIVKLLLEKGANTELKCFEGRTAAVYGRGADEHMERLILDWPESLD